MDEQNESGLFTYEQEQWERERKSMSVYKAICAITAELSKVGISKDSTNSQQNYRFRGIDAVYGALSPLLAKHGLCVLPRVTERSVMEKETRNGGTLFYTVLKVEFDFVAAEDGSKHTVCTVGEAMDSGDKSSNKAMSAAYKYACFQAFCIPTEGDNDADATTHEVVRPDTRKINKHAQLITEAVAKDNVALVKELIEEGRDGGEAFWSSVWVSLGKPIKDYIHTNIPRNA